MREQKFILYWNGTSETLTINPDGWSRNGQRWQRDRVYYGVFQTYTVETFRFSTKSGGGGDFILNAYDTDDIRADITVEVYNRNSQTNDYDLAYTGKLNIDPDKFTNDPLDKFIEVGFVQNSNVQKFITRDELELNIKDTESVDGIEMDANTNPVSNITLPGIDLFRIANVEGDYNYNYYYSFPDGPTGDGERIYPGTEIRIKYYASTIITNELGSDLTCTAGPNYAERSEFIYVNNNSFETEITIDNVTIQNNTSKPGNFALRVEFYEELTLPFNYRISLETAYIIKDEEGNIFDSSNYEIVYVDKYDSDIFNNGFKNVYLSFDDFIGDKYTVPAGGSLWLGVKTNTEQLTSSDVYIEVKSINDANFEITEKSAASKSGAIECYSPLGVFKRQFQMITSSENTFVSEFFETGEGANAYLTNGFNIREFPNRALTVTLKDSFQSYGSIYNLGLSYDQTNERFYVEEITEFFDIDNVMFDVGEVDEFRIRPFKDAYFNEYHGGNENEGEYENVQGVNEFNVKASWSADMPIKEKFLRRSNYYTDTVGIELARRKIHKTDASLDTDYDDRNYIIYAPSGTAERASTYKANGFAGISQYYNMRFSPRNNLLRHANWIKAMFWKDPSFEVRFRKSKKGINITYISILGDTISEFDNITASEVLDVLRLFNPQYYEFSGVFDSSFREALQSNPHGIIRFSHLGTNYAGFVDEIQTQDYERTAEYKLIATNTAAGALKIFTDDNLAEFTDDSLHELI